MAIRKQTGLKCVLCIILALTVLFVSSFPVFAKEIEKPSVVKPAIATSDMSNTSNDYDDNYISLISQIVGIFMLIFGILSLIVAFKNEDNDAKFRSILCICFSVPPILCPALIVYLSTPI